MVTSYRTPGLPIKFSESTVDKQIQLFRVGTFNHPEYGEFKITPEFLAHVKNNFDAKVRGIDIAVDYKHASEDVAAGWMKELVLEEDELYALVEWTPRGLQILADKEFRYISPEFTFNYQDNETLKDCGPTLLGAGLTNRPVIKRMQPVVELAEGPIAPAPSEKQKLQKGEKKMADAPVKPCAEMSPEEMMAMIEQLKAELAKVKGEHAAMAGEKKMSEKKATFAKMLAEGKACAAQEEAFLKDDMIQFAEKAQPVKLSEQGQGGKKEEESTKGMSVDDKIIAAAEKLMKEKGIKDVGTAYALALRNDEQLRKEKYGN